MSHDFGEVAYYDGLVLSKTFNCNNSKNIKSFHPSCGCLTTIKQGNDIKVLWKVAAPTINNYASRKYVTVLFKDGEEEEIKLTATILK
jgi:hypothetical protein